MGRVNQLIDKSKGNIVIEKNKVLKGVKTVYRNGIKLFSYTLNDEIYCIMPCGDNFYYTSTIKMNESQFAYFLADIDIEEDENFRVNNFDIEKYTAILTDAPIDIFNKIFIEKQSSKGIEALGYKYKYIEDRAITNEIIKLMEHEYLNYYDIQEDRFYSIKDFKEEKIS